MNQPGPAGSAPSGRPGQSSRFRHWWLSGTKEWLGLLSAILGFAVAVLGVVAYNTGQSRDQAQQATARLKTENSQFQGEIDATNAHVKSLNAALDQAQRTLKAAGLPPVPNGSTSQGRVTLSPGYSIDLDSTAPDWGVVNPFSAGITDLYSDGDLVAGKDIAQLNESDPSTFAACRAETNYQGPISALKVIPGARFCVRSTSGNLVLVRVDAATQATSLSSPVTFSVIVWKAS
jgi:hypothetical protein